MKKRGKTRYGLEILFELLFFCVAVILTIFFWRNIYLLAILLLILWLIAIKLWHTPKEVVVFVVSAVMGPVAEIFIVNLGGAWIYPKPSLLGIPLWLPFLWGFSGLLLYKLANAFYDWRYAR